jgi:hypothetical protein
MRDKHGDTEARRRRGKGQGRKGEEEKAGKPEGV